MKLLLRRLYRKPTYTIGKLYIDDVYLCDTAEDVDRGLYSYMNIGEISKIKVKDETAIPYGKYKVRLSMSPRFKKILPEIINVPGFTGVRIHSGNDPKTDSSGCILPGYNTIKGKVTSSRKVMEVLMEKLKEVPTSETIELEITQ